VPVQRIRGGPDEGARGDRPDAGGRRSRQGFVAVGRGSVLTALPEQPEGHHHGDPAERRGEHRQHGGERIGRTTESPDPRERTDGAGRTIDGAAAGRGTSADSRAVDRCLEAAGWAGRGRALCDRRVRRRADRAGRRHDDGDRGPRHAGPGGRDGRWGGSRSRVAT